MLRARRRQLAQQFDEVSSAGELMELQLRIVDEIRAVEPVAFRDRSSPERDHLKLMRLFGDAVAHATLHTHTILQLSKHPGKPPSLSSQGKGFEFVLQCAELAANYGHAVRISDLTNVLKIGDLVIGGPEKPMLIECGSDEATAERGGRKARQVERMRAVAQILDEGHGFVPGTLVPVKVFDSPVEAEHTWASVEHAARAAEVDGIGVVGTTGDVVCAVRSDCLDGLERALMGEVRELTADFRDPLLALVSSRLDDPLPTVPPPLAYPLPLDLRIGLLERDIRLVHVIDLAAFAVERDGARVSGFRRDRHGSLVEPPFELETDSGYAGVASSRFLDEVLFGFVTIASSAETMLRGLDALDDAPGHGLETAAPDPMANVVRELKERSESLSARGRRGPDLIT